MLFSSACANQTDDVLALDGDATAGAETYAAECASCHGDAGEGATGPALAGSGVDREEVVDLVVNGKEEMPAFGDTLSDQEIADVAAYVADDLGA